MTTFSEWKNNKQPLNEGVNYADEIRARLGSTTDYLRQALGVSPENEQKPIINEELERQLSSLETKIQQELEKTKETVVEEETQEEIEEPVVQEAKKEDDSYRLYRDKEETFECNISVEGASLSSAQARVLIDTNVFNVVFYGKIYKDGRCMIPLKKMTMFPEGTRGQIRLEVIVDDTVFSPWESTCLVEGAKKVFVDIKQKKNVSINFGETSK